LLRRHLARCGDEFAMFDPAASLDRRDAHVVGRIRETHGGAFAAHELVHTGSIRGITAMKPVLAQQPQVIPAAHRGFCDIRNLIVRVLLRVKEIAHDRVDLGGLEPGQFDTETRLIEERSQFTQFDGECLSIVAGQLC
jgi:hypothetical protein